MAKTSYIDLNPADELLFYKNLQSGDRFTFPRIIKKTALFSRKKKQGMSQKSLLPIIAPIWNAMDLVTHEAWKSAGAVIGMKGYNLFVQDQCLRIINDIAGVATPSVLHQSFVGEILIQAPATAISIAQFHPRKYYVSRAVYGKKGMREAVEVIENFALPLQISLSYKSNLSAVGAGAYARYRAEVRSSYQGVDRFTNVTLNLDLTSDWKTDSASLSNVIGYVIGYTLFLECFNVQGTLQFDNIKAVHSSQNWVRDTMCKDIDETFNTVFYQIPKHWIGIDLPSGSEYRTVYPLL